VETVRLDRTGSGKRWVGHGLIALALQDAGIPRSDVRVSKGLACLQNIRIQSRNVVPTSLNKDRDPNSDIGNSMSDAATAYAVLALTAETPALKQK